MRVLVIGSGAREHALLLGAAPRPRGRGAGGRARQRGHRDHRRPVRRRHHLAARPSSKLAQRIGADLVVIGPEVPLVLGVADAVRAAGIACFGPTKDAARIEGSKSFAKDVMTAAGVRTATSEIVDNPAHLDAALDRFGPPAAIRHGWSRTTAWPRARAWWSPPTATPRARTPPACSTPATRCCWSRSSTAPRCRCSASSTARPWCRCCPRRTSSASATATPGPTPVAWAPTRRCRGCPTRCVTQIVDEVVKPVAAEMVHAGQLVLRSAVRRAGDHLAGPRGRRIQLPLRRSGDAVGAGAAGHPARTAAARRRHRPAGRPAAAAMARRLRRDGRGRRGELSGPAAGRRRDRRRRGRRRAARGHRPPRRRRDRVVRRAGAVGRRDRRRTWRRPAMPPMR